MKECSCPKCGYTGSATEWNKKTAELLDAEDENLIDIEDSEGDENAYFICPGCGKPSFGDQIVRTANTSPTQTL